MGDYRSTYIHTLVYININAIPYTDATGWRPRTQVCVLLKDGYIGEQQVSYRFIHTCIVCMYAAVL